MTAGIISEVTFEASPAAMSGGVLTAVLALTPAVVLVRMANFRTHNLGINAISYLVPVVTVVLLGSFGQLGDVRLSYIAIGASLVVAANLLLNLQRGKK